MTRSKTPKYKRKNINRSRSSRSLFLTLGAAALLIVGGGLAYFFFQSQRGSGALPIGSELLPADTSYTVTLTTQESQWANLQAFNIPQTRQVLQSGLDSFKSQVLNPHGLNYDQDIKPWLGSRMTMAVLTPKAQSGETLAAQSQAWILPVRDRGRAQQFLNQRLSENGTSVAQAQYQGIDIRTLKAPTSESLSLAILDQSFVVMANDLPTLREVIDTVTNQNSLASQERFQSAMAVIKDSDSFAQIYINIPANTSQLSEQQGRQIDQSTLDRLQEFQGFGSTVKWTSEGLAVNAVSWLSPDAQEGLTVSGALQDLDQNLPGDTMLMTSGDSFQQMWQDYQKGVEAQLILPFSPKALQDNFLKVTGLNFEETFLPWMTGEFAMGVVPANPKAANKDSGIAFLVRTRDKTAAEQTLRELEAQMREKYALQMSETKVDGHSVVQWRVPPNLPIASRGWLGDKILFFTFFGPITERIAGAEQSSLVRDKAYKAVTESQLTPQSGRFFVNVPQLTSFMTTSSFLPKLASPYQKYAKEFESVGGTSSTPNSWSTRYDVRINFVKK